MESKATIGAGLTIPIILGVVFMIFGLGSAFYGAALLSDASTWSGQSGSPYNDSLLTYVPEFVLVSAACIFSLGIMILLYATEKRRPPPMPK